MLRLFIEPVSMGFAELYRKAADAYNSTPPTERNSGFDLHCDIADVNNKYSAYAALVGQGCRAVALDKDGAPRAFWLSPRSSISKTPLQLANSLGLIDATYRGWKSSLWMRCRVRIRHAERADLDPLGQREWVQRQWHENQMESNGHPVLRAPPKVSAYLIQVNC